MEITVRSYFDAAHFLPNYPGKCSRVHGHRWVVEATFSGELDPVRGMLRDFVDLKMLLKMECDRLDHQLINDLGKQPSCGLEAKLLEVPTAENLAIWLFGRLQAGSGNTSLEICGLLEVRVFESPDCWVTYRG